MQQEKENMRRKKVKEVRKGGGKEQKIDVVEEKSKKN